MAQHDYVIDNSTGANVRADINNALLAISSNNSGSSAPSTTYALQSFANTTDNMLQLRNAANSAFVNLRGFDGKCPIPDGTNSAPSLFFDDDTNTGIFSSAADTFNIATGGTERMELGTTTIFNEDGADVDFRIEGDSNANLFYVDAGNDRVAVGTNTPDALVHFEQSVAASSDLDPTFLFLENASDGGSAIEFKNSVNGKTKLSFGVIGTGANTDDTFIGFETSKNASLGEKMRIDEDGNVGIGTSNPDRLLHLSGADTAIIRLENTDTSLTTNQIIGGVEFEKQDASGAGVGVVGGLRMYSGVDGITTYLTLSTSSSTTNDVERFRINDSGRLTILRSSTTGYITSNTTNDTSFLIQNDGAAGHTTMQFQVLSGGTANTGIATISAFPENASSKATALSFGTRNQFGSTKERARVTSDGNILIATTSTTINSSNFGIGLFGDHGIAAFKNTDGSGTVIRLGGNQGLMEVKGDGDIKNTNNSYGPISSDERLKENIVDVTSQWEDVKNIVLKKFTYKNSKTGTVQIGPIAQELQKVCPNLIKSRKASEEEINDSEGLIKEGDEVLTYKASIMLLKGFKALQEAMAKIETLETKVAALESA